jgi:predicted RecA/RadA family phage recombinase
MDTYKFVQPGKTVDAVAPAGGVVKGDVVLINSLIGVAELDAAAGEEFTLTTEGVFDLPVASALDVPPGQLLYWDAADGEFNDDAANNKLGGVALTAAGAGVTSAWVKLRQPVS